MFTNIYPYTHMNQLFYGVTPVACIEETENLFPDWSGNPLFFYDKSRNEFFVKQRKKQSGEIELLRYAHSNEPLNCQALKNTNNYDEQIDTLKNEIDRLNNIITGKSKKAVNDDE